MPGLCSSQKEEKVSPSWRLQDSQGSGPAPFWNPGQKGMMMQWFQDKVHLSL